MKREEISELIDRAIGGKGILRTPSYWVKRIFNQVLEYSEESSNTALKVVDKKAETYMLPTSGEYALDSETGKKLLEILNNPDKYILLSNQTTFSGATGTITLHPNKYNLTPDALILQSPAWKTKEAYLNGNLTEVELTVYMGAIAKGDGIIQFSLGPTTLSIPIVGYVTDELTDFTEYAVQGKVIKKYVDDNKVAKVEGKQLSTEDFTTALKQKLEGLNNYDDTSIVQAVESLQNQFNALVGGDASEAIESFNEVIAFLANVLDTESLSAIIASIEKQIADTQAEFNRAIQGISEQIPKMDSEMNNDSENAVQNKVIKAYVDESISTAITTTLNTAV